MMSILAFISKHVQSQFAQRAGKIKFSESIKQIKYSTQTKGSLGVWEECAGDALIATRVRALESHGGRTSSEASRHFLTDILRFAERLIPETITMCAGTRARFHLLAHARTCVCTLNIGDAMMYLILRCTHSIALHGVVFDNGQLACCHAIQRWSLGCECG